MKTKYSNLTNAELYKAIEQTSEAIRSEEEFLTGITQGNFVLPAVALGRGELLESHLKTWRKLAKDLEDLFDALNDPDREAT
jgi:hypothetical protein